MEHCLADEGVRRIPTGLNRPRLLLQYREDSRFLSLPINTFTGEMEMRKVSLCNINYHLSLRVPRFSNTRAFQGFLSQQTSPSLGSQPSETGYPSTLPRCSSAPDLFPQARIFCNGYPTQHPITDSGRTRSNLPNFESSHPFQPVSTYQSQQDSISLPGTQPPVFHRYLEVGTSPYNPPPRISAYHDSPHGFIETIPTVDPHVLHRVPSHRHSSWDDSGVEPNYDGTAWTAGVRDQNYRHQMAYESGNQAGYREDYQYSTVSKPGLVVLLRAPLVLLY